MSAPDLKVGPTCDVEGRRDLQGGRVWAWTEYGADDVHVGPTFRSGVRLTSGLFDREDTIRFDGGKHGCSPRRPGDLDPINRMR